MNTDITVTSHISRKGTVSGTRTGSFYTSIFGNDKPRNLRSRKHRSRKKQNQIHRKNLREEKFESRSPPVNNFQLTEEYCGEPTVLTNEKRFFENFDPSIYISYRREPLISLENLKENYPEYFYRVVDYAFELGRHNKRFVWSLPSLLRDECL